MAPRLGAGALRGEAVGLQGLGESKSEWTLAIIAPRTLSQTGLVVFDAIVPGLSSKQKPVRRSIDSWSGKWMVVRKIGTAIGEPSSPGPEWRL